MLAENGIANLEPSSDRRGAGSRRRIQVAVQPNESAEKSRERDNKDKHPYAAPPNLCHRDLPSLRYKNTGLAMGAGRHSCVAVRLPTSPGT